MGQDSKGSAYIWSANILSSSFDTTRLFAALVVDANVPSILYKILDFKYGWYPVIQELVTLRSSADYIRTHHLDIAIPAKAPCRLSIF